MFRIRLIQKLPKVFCLLVLSFVCSLPVMANPIATANPSNHSRTTQSAYTDVRLNHQNPNWHASDHITFWQLGIVIAILMVLSLRRRRGFIPITNHAFEYHKSKTLDKRSSVDQHQVFDQSQVVDHGNIVEEHTSMMEKQPATDDQKAIA